MNDQRIHEMKENYCDNPSPSLLNEDSLIQIFLWLPVLSLLRFKSVCKSWRNIIENPFFIHSHAIFQPKNTTTTNQLGLGLGIPIFFRYTFCLRIGNIFTVSGDNEFEVLEELGIPPTPYCNRVIDYYAFYCKVTTVSGDGDGYGDGDEEIPPPPSPPHPFKDVTMVGCSNGIICLHNRDVCNDVFLWNPATKQCRLLPKPFPLEGNRRDVPVVEDYHDIDDIDDYVCYFVGFGFDIKTKDYKVFQITSFKPDKEDENMDDEEKEYRYAREVQVYSLNTDSWRRFKDISTTLSNLIMYDGYWNRGYCLNGTYLFMAGCLCEEGEIFQGANNSRRKYFKPVIMSFDFTEESFRTIQLPFDCKNNVGGDEYIILFGEKIAVTNVCVAWVLNEYGGNETYCERIDIWVLNEHGGNESWSKFYTFMSISQPKFITDNGEFILLDGEKLQLLNLVTGEIKELQCDYQGSSRRDGVHISRVGVYKPSLVPIAANGATDNNLQV